MSILIHTAQTHQPVLGGDFTSGSEGKLASTGTAAPAVEVSTKAVPTINLDDVTASPGTKEIALISERQRQWDRQAASADQKQAELSHIQWNLIREQIATFAREIVAVRSDLKALKRVETQQQEELNAEKVQRQELQMEIEEKLRATKESNELLLVEFQEVLKSVADMVAHETKERLMRDRHVADEEATRQFHQFVSTMQQECSNRELGDSNLRSQLAVLQQDLNAERSKRSEEVAALWGGLQASDAQVLQMLKDFRQTLDTETGERVSSADRLEKRFVELWSALDTEAAKIRCALEAEVERWGRMAQDLERSQRGLQDALHQEARARSDGDTDVSEAAERGFRSLSAAFEQEAKQRAADNEAKGEALKSLHAELEIETLARKENELRACEEFREASQSLSNTLLQDARERSAGNEEVLRIAMQTKQLAEKESWDRLQANEDINKRLQDLSTVLDLERGQREHGDSHLCAQLAACRKHLTAEISKRADEAAAMSCGLQTLECHIVQMLKDVGLSLEAEVGERSAAYERLETRCIEWRIALDKEAVKYAKAAEDAAKGIQCLCDTREKDVEMECRKVARMVEDMSGHVEKFFEALNTEMQDRKAGDEEAMRSLSDTADRLEAMILDSRDTLRTRLALMAECFVRCGRDLKEASGVGGIPMDKITWSPIGER